VSGTKLIDLGGSHKPRFLRLLRSTSLINKLSEIASLHRKVLKFKMQFTYYKKGEDQNEMGKYINGV